MQDKLRDELTMACDTGKQIDYDYLLNLPYLDAIMRETLRLYVHTFGSDTSLTSLTNADAAFT